MKFLKFLALPMLTLWVLQLIQMFVIGFVLGGEPDGWLNGIASFFVYSIFGFAIYDTAPRNKLVWSSAYGFLYCALMILMALAADNKPTAFDASQPHEFNAIFEGIMVFAVIFGIFSARSNETSAAADREFESAPNRVG